MTTRTLSLAFAAVAATAALTGCGPLPGYAVRDESAAQQDVIGDTVHLGATLCLDTHGDDEALSTDPGRCDDQEGEGQYLHQLPSFAGDGGGSVMVTALKGTEDATDAPGGADVVVRAVETRGEAGRSRIELPLLGRTIEEDFGPSQLRTFVVPADPAEPVREVDLIERPLP